jgi:hypothetical protein
MCGVPICSSRTAQAFSAGRVFGNFFGNTLFRSLSRKPMLTRVAVDAKCRASDSFIVRVALSQANSSCRWIGPPAQNWIELKPFRSVNLRLKVVLAPLYLPFARAYLQCDTCRFFVDFRVRKTKSLFSASLCLSAISADANSSLKVCFFFFYFCSTCQVVSNLFPLPLSNSHFPKTRTTITHRHLQFVQDTCTGCCAFAHLSCGELLYVRICPQRFQLFLHDAA